MMTTRVNNPPPMYMISLPFEIAQGSRLVVTALPLRQNTKKADVLKHPQAFQHVGLLVNQPPGTAGLLFI